MKKGIFLLAFVFGVALATAGAQSCTAGAATAGKTCCPVKMAAAAASDATIEKRQADNGTVSYVRKETDNQGNVRFVSVQFDETKNGFVNVNTAPKTATASEKATATKKEACAAGAKKGCCASKTTSAN